MKSTGAGAEKVAGYLVANEEPRNSEEKLLQELWKVGTQAERISWLICL